MSKQQKNNQIQFNDQPYYSNKKFSVYIPKQKDEILELIEREKQKSQNYSWLPQISVKNKKSIQQDIQNQQPQNNISQIEQLHQEQSQDSKIQNISQSQLNLSHDSIKNNLKSQKKRDTKFYNQKNIEQLRYQLYFDDKTKTLPKTTVKNKIVEKIVQDGDVFLKDHTLLENVYKLKQLNLLKEHDIHVKRYEGIGKLGFVYNDFHTKSTNPGFSRNAKGGFYTK